MENFYLSDANFFVIFLVIGVICLSIARRILKFQSSIIMIGLVGLLFGLVVGNLLGGPFGRLPGAWGRWTPVVIQVVVAATVVDFFLGQSRGWVDFFSDLNALIFKKREKIIPKIPEILVDTSIFIDGRIEELARTGFILGKLVIPRFVLDELQKVSDSKDDLKRARGRRGLDVLVRLSKNPQVNLEIIETDFPQGDIDKKLVKLAKIREAKLLTCDHNLNRVAEISGVRVLNLNELSNALKPLVLPGEDITVKIIAPGKEKNQGVGYLADGTMVVVENGSRLVGSEIECQVERIYQTIAGKMIFVKPKP